MTGELDIHHHVTQLTRQHTIGTPYTTFKDGELATAYHYTQAPALLYQLEHAMPSSARPMNGDESQAGYGSRPAARIEALDTLMNIDRQAAAWIRFLGHDDPGNTVACVIRVGALYPSADKSQKQIERDVKSWWTQARVTTGYDSPAWRPDNSCPLCAATGTLRVKLSTTSAVCIGCFETWDGTTIAFLADHIRLENAEDVDEDDTELPTEGDAA